MQTICYPASNVSTGSYAATIGFFDGVHLGHRYLLEQLRSHASQKGLGSMAITFDRHPRQVLQQGWEPQFLTTFAEREELLSCTGVDVLVCVHFDTSIASMSARRFLSDVLRDRLHVRSLLMGYDNRFGCGGGGTFADCQLYGRELGVDVALAEPLLPGGRAVSSSLLRRLLSDGDVEGAASGLGREYAIKGMVTTGRHVGSALGFPTANLVADDPLKLIPACGVYAVEALVRGRSYPAMMNIGFRPTFGCREQTLEVHIFGEVGDLYGEPLCVKFVARLRDERTFPSAGALASQLALDMQNAKAALGSRKHASPVNDNNYQEK